MKPSVDSQLGVPHPPREEEEDDSSLDRYLRRVNKMTFFCDAKHKGSLKGYMDYYRKRATWSRRIFRLTGLFAIILSLSLPVLSRIEFKAEEKGRLAISIVAMAVALLTTVNSFLRSDSSWRGARHCLLALQDLRARWELDIAEARFATNDKDALSLAVVATRTLVTSVHEIVRTEAGRFFSGLKFPVPDGEAKDDDPGAEERREGL